MCELCTLSDLYSSSKSQSARTLLKEEMATKMLESWKEVTDYMVNAPGELSIKDAESFITADNPGFLPIRMRVLFLWINKEIDKLARLPENESMPAEWAEATESMLNDLRTIDVNDTAYIRFDDSDGGLGKFVFIPPAPGSDDDNLTVVTMLEQLAEVGTSVYQSAVQRRQQMEALTENPLSALLALVAALSSRN